MDLLNSPEFDYVRDQDKAFITAFNNRMNELGYDCGNRIGPGYCWGRHMLIYTKTDLKSKNVVCRIYIREGEAVLRMFLKNIDAHRGFVEASPAHIKGPFIDGNARCNHCKPDCAFRKSYTIDGEAIDKCGGVTFEFRDTGADRIADYLALFEEFFAVKRKS